MLGRVDPLNLHAGPHRRTPLPNLTACPFGCEHTAAPPRFQEAFHLPAKRAPRRPKRRALPPVLAHPMPPRQHLVPLSTPGVASLLGGPSRPQIASKARNQCAQRSCCHPRGRPGGGDCGGAHNRGREELRQVCLRCSCNVRTCSCKARTIASQVMSALLAPQCRLGRQAEASPLPTWRPRISTGLACLRCSGPMAINALASRTLIRPSWTIDSTFAPFMSDARKAPEHISSSHARLQKHSRARTMLERSVTSETCRYRHQKETVN